MMDVKIRDLMATAAAALVGGGVLLLAHEIRGDMREVLGLMEKVSSAVLLFFSDTVAVVVFAIVGSLWSPPLRVCVGVCMAFELRSR